MRINGTYVGLGEGDTSPEVGKVKALLKRKFTPARNTLDDSDVFTPALTAEIKRVQGIYTAQGRPGAPFYVPGVINLEFKYDVGLLPRPEKPKPIFFTLEGHMSNMFFGPCASNASLLESQGLCHWKPLNYDCNALPFNNQSGVDALFDQLARTRIEGPPGPDGRPIMWDFSPDRPWVIKGFSQGALVLCNALDQLPNHPNPVVRARASTLRRSLCLGNPRRGRDAIAPWADDPPNPGTSGVFVHRQFIAPAYLAGKHQENANRGDMFADNTDDKTGWDKEAIAKIICENSWIGGPAAIFTRVLALFSNPTGEAFYAIKAAFDAFMFLISNPNPHYATVAEPGDIEWMRAGLVA